MKRTNLFAAILLITIVAMISCKSKSAKELIVNKWKFTNISGGDADKQSDSDKKRLYANATMEFTTEGKYFMGGDGFPTKRGTYSISNDNKILITKDEESNSNDSISIVDISNFKMNLVDKKSGIKLSFAVK